jgi:hypothetical protein
MRRQETPDDAERVLALANVFVAVAELLEGSEGWRQSGRGEARSAVVELEDRVADHPRSPLRVQDECLREFQRVVVSNFHVAGTKNQDGAIHHGLAVASCRGGRELDLGHPRAILHARQRAQQQITRVGVRKNGSARGRESEQSELSSQRFDRTGTADGARAVARSGAARTTR